MHVASVHPLFSHNKRTFPEQKDILLHVILPALIAYIYCGNPHHKSEDDNSKIKESMKLLPVEASRGIFLHLSKSDGQQ